jgi:AraC-like DNA-binding protein
MASSDRILVLDQGLQAAVVDVGAHPRAHYTECKSLNCGEWAVMHVTRGEGYITGPGFEQEVRPGTILSLPPGPKDFFLGADHQAMVLTIRDPSEKQPERPGFLFPLIRQLSPFESRRWAHRLAGAAHDISSARFDDAAALTLRDELSDLRWLPSRINGRFIVEETLSAMRANLDEPLRLTGRAREQGYTANYLNDLTRLHTGRSLGRWLSDMRMSRARALLETTPMAIAQIGPACGYEDPAYFSRAFRRVHGVSPALWRIAHSPADPRHRAVTVSLDQMMEVEERISVSVSV